MNRDLFPRVDPAAPAQPMRHWFARLGSRAWLATSPDTHSLGNAVLNAAWSFFMARKVNAVLCVEPIEADRFPELWRLRCAGVDSVGFGSRHTAHSHRAFRAASALAYVVGWSGVAGSVRGPADLPRRARRPWMYQANFALEFRRLFALEPLKVSLGGDDDRRAAAGMAALGLDDGRPLVTLHVRGPGYKASRGIRDRSKDSVRNARLESYIPAVDWLVSRGYTVVRIGDASMEPLQRAGVVDLARWPSRSLGLDIQCVKRSQFFIATDSGPYNLALLCNIPCLATNMTHVLGAYPLRARDRYIVRHVDDLSEGRRMTLEDMLTPRHLKFRWDDSLYRFHDNSADEILAGVREMSAVIRGKWEPTPAQRRFRLAVEAFLSSPYGLRKLKRSGADGETPHFVGDGWATQASADIVCEHAPRMA